MMEQKKYAHAYSLGFSVQTNDPEHCTFEEFLGALLKHIGNIEGLREAWEEELPYDSFKKACIDVLGEDPDDWG